MYLLLLPKGQTDPAGIFGAMGVGGGEEKITEMGDHWKKGALLWSLGQCRSKGC